MTEDLQIDRKIDEQNNEIGVLVPEIEPLSWRFWRKRRYIVVLMAFFGFFNVLSLRGVLGIAIVAMTENRTVYYPNGTIGYEQEFPWDSKDRGIILSSFFWGYILTNFIGGVLGSKFGGNRVFGFGIVVTAVLTLLTPLAAKAGFSTLITVRFIEGVFEGITFPSIHAIWSQWAPPLERSRMASIAFTGNYVGLIVSMSVSGILVTQCGWESLFYVSGTFGCVWYLLWVAIVRGSPDMDRYISKDELRYIQESLCTKNANKIKHPWKKIFTSKPVYAISAVNFSETWGFNVVLTQLPAFLKSTLGFKLENVGLLMGAPYLAMSTMLVMAGYFSDILQIKGYLTTTQVRRYFICGGLFSQPIFLMIASYLMSPTETIACIIIALGFGGFVLCGYSVNHLDIAPQHASVLMGIANTISQSAAIVSPALTGYIVVNASIDEWQLVFMITSAIYLLGSVIYWIWGSGEIQSWAKDKLASNNNKKESSDDIDIGYVNEVLEMD